MATLSFGVAAPLAYAKPIDDKRAELQKIKAQVDDIDGKLDVIVEKYNEKNLALTETEEELQDAKAKLEAAESELASRQESINKRFAGVYRQGSLSYIEILINTKSFDQFLYYYELLERQSEFDTQIMGQVRQSKAEIEKQSAALLEKEQKQKAIVAELKNERAKIEAQLKEKNAIMAKVKRDFNALLVAEEKEEAKRQAELRKKLRLAYDKPSGSSVAVSRGGGGGRSGVVGIAMGTLGKPYAWAASGPNAFDCSGLTRYVYGQAGVSLPHSSRAQYSCGTRVSRDQLQAGDLVFFSRSGTISHVGIYVGGGNFIHAPRTGEVVRVQSIGSHSGYVGAVRP